MTVSLSMECIFCCYLDIGYLESSLKRYEWIRLGINRADCRFKTPFLKIV